MMTGAQNPAVRRALLRDDLLTLAAEADRAIGIVRQHETLPRRDAEDGTLFDLALDQQLSVAEGDGRSQRNESQSVRAQAWDYAGVLLRFCEFTGTKLITPRAARYTSAQLHERAVAEVALLDDPDALHPDRDLMLGVFLRYHAARDLRLAGEHDAALKTVDRPLKRFFGTGAEPYLAHYLFEKGANLITLGKSADIDQEFGELDGYWMTRAAGFSTRHRLDFIRALAMWNTDPRDEGVDGQLATSIKRLADEESIPDPIYNGKHQDPAKKQGVRELSVIMAAAEHLAEAEPEAAKQAVRHGTSALAIADTVRSRWKVVARSRAPLAVVFQRIYGDLALLADRLPGQDGAELGFRVALAAKQTGFAARIRDGLTFHGNPRVDGLIKEIKEIEGDTRETLAYNSAKRTRNLEAIRFELAETVSPMLADTVFPSPGDPVEVVRALGPRYALDFIELPDTLDDRPHMFRTLIQPGGLMWFEAFEADEGFRTCFEPPEPADDPADRSAPGQKAAPAPELMPMPEDTGQTREIARQSPRLEDDLDWRALAVAVLPPRLMNDVLADAGLPVRLLISAHSWLSRVPWAALRIDDQGTRLVDRAVTTQTPVLTCLAGTLPPRIAGRALVRLVGTDEKGVDVGEERTAWGLTRASTGLPLSEFRIDSPRTPATVAGRFDEALGGRDTWDFLHVAAHGDGKGFDQSLHIPGESLSAARALGLKWPKSVLMASCHVGLVVNDTRSEPLNYVVAMLTGGAHCVVAGIDSVNDHETGRAAAHMVREILRGGVSLDIALRNAQLAAIASGVSETGWALLSAYSR